MRVHAHRIIWDTTDTDGAAPRLPHRLSVTIDEAADDREAAIADALSDRTGYCVISFRSTNL